MSACRRRSPLPKEATGVTLRVNITADTDIGGVTFFHATEPFREGKPTDMVRTDSQGIKIAEELIGGARREGRKFLNYHYDNPAIEGDEETGSPKLGYAVSFQIPNSEQRGVTGSGIYLDTDGE